MSAYFQGGDYIELLSAQGTTPAATWKLQGKITKAFEKTIRGNAFVLDGGTETKMQLPKNPSQPALGVAQRFLILQLHIPLARSFAVEIGFADFQKIRRRFVFASAFRETVMNALHVQIPFGATVTRDRWMNLVFDLQALTETYFSSSTFRSVESLYISGSCKLKRVFTMKDAPAWDHRQQVSGARSALVANHADMREIPKQFVFTTTTSGVAPIPTEYFIMPTCANGGGNGNGAVKREGEAIAHMKAAPSGVRKTTSLTPRTQASRLSRNQMRLKSRPSSGNAVIADSKQPPTPSVVGPSPVAEQREAAPAVRPTSSSSRPTASAGRFGTRHMIRDELQPLPPAPLSLRGSLDSSRFDGSDEEIDQLHDSPISEERRHSPAKSKDRDDWHHSCSSSASNGQEARLLSASPVYECRPFVTRDAMDLHASKEKCRQAIVTEIQQKLDQLTASEELEEERNHKLFLEHTSLRSCVGFGLEEACDLRTRSMRSSVVDDLHDLDAPQEATEKLMSQQPAMAEAQTHSLLNIDNSLSLKNSSKILALDSALPEKSIFAFPSYGDRPAKSSVLSLYDFDSLLGATTELKQFAVMDSSRQADRSIFFSRKDGSTENCYVLAAPSPDTKAQEDDDELTLLLAAKRLARQWQREGRQHLMQSEPQKAPDSGKREGLDLRLNSVSDCLSEIDITHVEEYCNAIDDAAIETGQDEEYGSDDDDDLSIDLCVL